MKFILSLLVALLISVAAKADPITPTPLKPAGDHDITDVFYQLYSWSAWDVYEEKDVYLTPDSITFNIKQDPRFVVKLIGSYEKIEKNIYFFTSTKYETTGASIAGSKYSDCQHIKIEIYSQIAREHILDIHLRHYKSKEHFLYKNSCSGSGYHPIESAPNS